MNSVELYIPFELKDKAKKYGAKWSTSLKLWTASLSVVEACSFLQKYREKPYRIYFNLAYIDKDDFKSKGGIQDAELRHWYLMSDKDIPEEYKQYLTNDDDDGIPQNSHEFYANDPI